MLLPPREPIYAGLVASPNVPEKVNGVPTDTPSTYNPQVVPDLTAATWYHLFATGVGPETYDAALLG